MVDIFLHSFKSSQAAATLFYKILKAHKMQNFNPIVAELNAYIGIVRLYIQSKLKLYRSHKNGNTFPQYFEYLIKVL